MVPWISWKLSLGNFCFDSKFRKHLRRVTKNHFSVFHSSPNLKCLKSRQSRTQGVLLSWPKCGGFAGKGYFRLQLYWRVVISQAEVYERVRKSEYLDSRHSMNWTNNTSFLVSISSGNAYCSPIMFFLTSFQGFRKAMQCSKEGLWKRCTKGVYKRGIFCVKMVCKRARRWTSGWSLHFLE